MTLPAAEEQSVDWEPWPPVDGVWRDNWARLLETLEWLEGLDDELLAIAFAALDNHARQRGQSSRQDGCWNPWTELMRRMTASDRRPLNLSWTLNGSAHGRIRGRPDGGHEVLLEASLMRRLRWETLTHELCHHERQEHLYGKTTPEPFIRSEEAVVNAMRDALLQQIRQAPAAQT